MSLIIKLYYNKSKNIITIPYINVKVADIQPNPFWDLDTPSMQMSHIKFWAVLIKQADIRKYPDCVMAVRPFEGKYQTINHHHQLAALRLLQVDEVKAPLMNFTNDEISI